MSQSLPGEGGLPAGLPVPASEARPSHRVARPGPAGQPEPAPAASESEPLRTRRGPAGARQETAAVCGNLSGSTAKVPVQQ